MSQGLIFIRTNVQLFLFNEVSCKTVLGTFVFYLYNAGLILFLSSQLILMIKMNHDYNYKHNLFTTFIVWNWFIIIATITSMFTLIYFETIFRIHTSLYENKRTSKFLYTFFFCTFPLPSFPPYNPIKHNASFEMWWKWHCDWNHYFFI